LDLLPFLHDDGGNFLGVELVLTAVIERTFLEKAWGTFDLVLHIHVHFSQWPTPVRIIGTEQCDGGCADMRAKVA
jgi:hypothetical protein